MKKRRTPERNAREISRIITSLGDTGEASPLKNPELEISRMIKDLNFKISKNQKERRTDR